MKRSRWIALAIVVVALVSFGAYKVGAPRQIKCARVRRGTSVSAVYATGVVQPVDRVNLGARIAGPIEAILVHEGDVVKKGDVVARIDSPVIESDAVRARVDSTAAAQRLAGGNAVESLRAQRKALEAQLIEARQELTRVNALSRAQAVSPAERERAKAQVDTLQAQIRTA